MSSYACRDFIVVELAKYSLGNICRRSLITGMQHVSNELRNGQACWSVGH